LPGIGPLLVVMGWTYLLLAGFCEIIYAAAMPRTEGFTRLGPSAFCLVFISVSMYLLALATRHADRVELYGLDGTLRGVGRGPAHFEPVYEVQSRGGVPFMATGDDLRFGYVDLVAAGDRLYALFSGYTRGERPGRSNFGQQVHVFDWTGRRLQVMQLDWPALGLAVDHDGRSLYAVRHDPQPAVVRYRLQSPR